MAFINSCHDQVEYKPGRFQSVVHLKPAAYLDKDTYKANDLKYAQTGTIALPYVLDKAPLIAQVGSKAQARMCPVRKDPNAYVQFGTPLFDNALVSMGTASLADQQAVKWDTTYFTMEWLHAGHYGSWLMTTRKGWAIPASIRFPVTVAGLKRDGDKFTYNGAPAGWLRAPTAHPVGDEMSVVQLPHVWDKTGLVIDTSALRVGEWVIDPTLVLQPDAAAGNDTFIGADAYVTYNFGLHIAQPSGMAFGGLIIYRSLLSVDLSGLPVGATISSAVARLYCYAEVNSTDRSIGLHKAITQWYEGSKNGAAPDPGTNGSTWNLRNANGSVAWAGGAGGASGSDWTAVATDSQSITGIDTYFNWTVTADVVAWYGGASNYGWWGINASQGVAGSTKNLASSDHTTVAYRPQLTVDYTLAGGSSKMGLLGGNIQTAWAF